MRSGLIWGDDVKDTSAARRSFDLMYDQHRRSILAYCRRRAPEHDALEAMNETFSIAWRRIDKAPEPADALPWLYSTARGVISNQRRRRQRYARLVQRTGALVAVEPPSPEAQVIYGHELGQVAEAMAGLRPTDREILQLHVWEELSHRDVATVLGISEAAARQRFSRALRRVTTEVNRVVTAADGGRA